MRFLGQPGVDLLRPDLGVELDAPGPPQPVRLQADGAARTLPRRFEAFQWHHYSHTLPRGAFELARSPVCLQAYRLGSAWGVQFHPEIRAEQVDAWLTEEPHDVAAPDDLRAATMERIEGWNELGRRLCTAFLDAA